MSLTSFPIGTELQKTLRAVVITTRVFRQLLSPFSHHAEQGFSRFTTRVGIFLRRSPPAMDK